MFEKPIKKVFLFILVASLTGCANISTTAEKTAIIWIADCTTDSLLFEILDNRTIEKTIGNVILDTETNEIFYGENTEHKVIKLSSAAASEIYNLIKKIESSSEDKVNPGNDSTEVFALINNTIYWTPLHSSSYQQSNKNLLKLTQILMEL